MNRDGSQTNHDEEVGVRVDDDLRHVLRRDVCRGMAVHEEINDCEENERTIHAALHLRLARRRGLHHDVDAREHEVVGHELRVAHDLDIRCVDHNHLNKGPTAEFDDCNGKGCVRTGLPRGTREEGKEPRKDKLKYKVDHIRKRLSG